MLLLYNWGEPERASHWSWQRPHMYVLYLTFSPTLVEPLFPRSVYPVTLPVYWYAHVRDLQLNSKDDWSYSSAVKKTIDEDRQVNVQTINGINGFSSGTIAARQLANAPVWLRNDQWAAWLYCWFVMFSYQHIGTTLYLLQCLRVICGSRAVQTNSAKTSLSLLAM